MDVMTAIAGIGMIVAVTVAIATRSRGQTASKPLVVIVYGMTASVAFAGVLALARESQARAVDLCVQRVERSIGSRDFNLDLIRIIDRELPNNPIGDELRESLEENLPVLDKQQCYDP